MKFVRTYWPFLSLAILWLCVAVCARGEWYEYAPARSTNQGGIYRETVSRCPAYGWQQISGTDKPTQCHEATHFINHEICGKRGQSYGAFYVGQGRCFMVAEPNVTVGVAARYVPQSRRTGRFKTYLSGDRTSRNVLTILDEWTCYVNDSQCTIELGLPTDGGMKFAGEFNHFVDAAIEAIKRHDPQYAQLSDLEQFVSWQKDRLAKLASHPAHGTDKQLMDLAPPLRRSNPDGSCVNCSVVMCLRWLGLYDNANQWWSRYRGGETDWSTRQHMGREGIDFAMTDDGDHRLLEWAIANRRGAAVVWGGAHCVNLVGRENGYAVILDNNQIGRFKRQPWSQFLREWRRCGGWAFVVLDGQVPPPLPEAA